MEPRKVVHGSMYLINSEDMFEFAGVSRSCKFNVTWTSFVITENESVLLCIHTNCEGISTGKIGLLFVSCIVNHIESSLESGGAYIEKIKLYVYVVKADTFPLSQ